MRIDLKNILMWFFMIIFYGHGQLYALESEFKGTESHVFSNSEKETKFRIYIANEFEGVAQQENDEEFFEFKSGEKLTITAEPSNGFYFSHWEINGERISEKNELEYVMPASDINVVGFFKKLTEPTIRIVSPGNNGSFDAGNDIPVKFDASSENGRITRVELFRNDVLIGSVANPDNNFTLTNLAIGNHTLKARVIDERGATATSPEVRIEVVKANIPPVVQIISPNNGEQFLLNTAIKVEAEAMDPDGEISRVEFFSNATLIGTSTAAPFNAVFSPAQPGKYELVAKAFDDKNANTTSGVVVVEVQGVVEIPNVSILSPIENEVFTEGTDVELMVMFNGNDEAVEKVSYYNGQVLIGVSNASPFSFEWKSVPLGNHKIRAVAYGGNPATEKQSDIVNIVVKEATVGKFSIISPTRNTRTYEGMDLEIKVELPTTTRKIAKVEFFRGNQRIGRRTAAPFNFIWENIPVGVHDLVARLFFEDGETVFSNIVKVFVEEGELPVINLDYNYLMNEENESSFYRLFLELENFKFDIEEVDLFLDGKFLVDLSSGSLTYDWQEDRPGSYRFKASVRDIYGNEFISDEFVLIIKDNQLNEGLGIVKEFDLRIGPNPTSDVLNVFFEEDLPDGDEFTVTIVSMNGLVNEKDIYKSFDRILTIDVNKLGRGVYLLYLEDESGTTARRKFIKN
ncbi:Ig-like domain-containing protein [Cecembia lonarensis]|uniref:Chitodextrinase n=1 Tax=Cecembia lonarensis (strain CCUG 58316 / KCTC 22772 / LW9) TaxID=1225176 RepID=K1M556_CECL9|nr:Ig-like domain-containing protein [Cecembia lonarensis]EKB51334.1 Chitodextrinase precursor [Cecembia lonarensis LW9]